MRVDMFVINLFITMVIRNEELLRLYRQKCRILTTVGKMASITPGSKKEGIEVKSGTP